MTDILIREDLSIPGWGAFVNNRRVASVKKCKGCLIKLMTKVVAQSEKYNRVVVLGKDGLVEKEIAKGAANVWQNNES